MNQDPIAIKNPDEVTLIATPSGSREVPSIIVFMISITAVLENERLLKYCPDYHLGGNLEKEIAAANRAIGKNEFSDECAFFFLADKLGLHNLVADGDNEIDAIKKQLLAREAWLKATKAIRDKLKVKKVYILTWDAFKHDKKTADMDKESANVNVNVNVNLKEIFISESHYYLANMSAMFTDSMGKIWKYYKNENGQYSYFRNVINMAVTASEGVRIAKMKPATFDAQRLHNSMTGYILEECAFLFAFKKIITTFFQCKEVDMFYPFSYGNNNVNYLVFDAFKYINDHFLEADQKIRFVDPTFENKDKRNQKKKEQVSPGLFDSKIGKNLIEANTRIELPTNLSSSPKPFNVTSLASTPSSSPDQKVSADPVTQVAMEPPIDSENFGAPLRRVRSLSDSSKDQAIVSEELNTSSSSGNRRMENYPAPPIVEHPVPPVVMNPTPPIAVKRMEAPKMSFWSKDPNQKQFSTSLPQIPLRPHSYPSDIVIITQSALKFFMDEKKYTAEQAFAAVYKGAMNVPLSSDVLNVNASATSMLDSEEADSSGESQEKTRSTQPK